MFYSMDYLPGVYESQVVKNGLPGPSNLNGWCPLNPNYPLSPTPATSPYPRNNPPGTVPPCNETGEPAWCYLPWRTNTPLLGLYASSDPRAIRQHAYWLASSGVTAIVVDWTNFGDPNLDDPHAAQPSFMLAQREALRVLLETYASITNFVPPRVIVAMRDFMGRTDLGGEWWWSQNETTARQIHELYQAYPRQWYYYDDNTKSKALPFLLIFSGAIGGGPAALWRPGAPKNFNIRWMNGDLIGAGITEPLSVKELPGRVAPRDRTWPYWSTFENRFDATGELPVFYRLDADGQYEFGLIKSAMYLGGYPVSGKWIVPRPSWIGMFDQEPGTGKILLELMADALKVHPPSVAYITTFNQPRGWYNYPGEGLSLNASEGIEPSYPLPSEFPFPGLPGELQSFATVNKGNEYEFGSDSSFFMLDKATNVLHELRKLPKDRPGAPTCKLCDHKEIVVRSNGFPTRIRLSAPSSPGRWRWISVDSMDGSGSWMRFSMPTDLQAAGVVRVELKNAFGTTEVSCACQ